jgi:hypothetical protein
MPPGWTEIFWLPGPDLNQRLIGREPNNARPVATQGPVSDNGLQDRRSTNTVSDGSATVAQTVVAQGQRFPRQLCRIAGVERPLTRQALPSNKV